MIQEDNKLARTRKIGYKRVVQKKEIIENKNPKLFDYSDYSKDDFFFGTIGKTYNDSGINEINYAEINQ